MKKSALPTSHQNLKICHHLATANIKTNREQTRNSISNKPPPGGSKTKVTLCFVKCHKKHVTTVEVHTLPEAEPPQF